MESFCVKLACSLAGRTCNVIKYCVFHTDGKMKIVLAATEIDRSSSLLNFLFYIGNNVSRAELALAQIVGTDHLLIMLMLYFGCLSWNS